MILAICTVLCRSCRQRQDLSARSYRHKCRTANHPSPETPRIAQRSSVDAAREQWQIAHMQCRLVALLCCAVDEKVKIVASPKIPKASDATHKAGGGNVEICQPPHCTALHVTTPQLLSETSGHPLLHSSN